MQLHVSSSYLGQPKCPAIYLTTHPKLPKQETLFWLVCHAHHSSIHDGDRVILKPAYRSSLLLVHTTQIQVGLEPASHRPHNPFGLNISQSNWHTVFSYRVKWTPVSIAMACVTTFGPRWQAGSFIIWSRTSWRLTVSGRFRVVAPDAVNPSAARRRFMVVSLRRHVMSICWWRYSNSVHTSFSVCTPPTVSH